MTRRVCLALAVALANLPASAQQAPAIERVLEEGREELDSARASQQRVEGLVDEARELSARAAAARSEAEQLRAYHDQVERLIGDQAAELASLERQLDAVSAAHRELLPLLARMVDALARFVDADLPFLPAERKLRVSELGELLDQADVPLAEKARRVLEAYGVEAEYGRALEAYRGALPGASKAQTVEFLRVGRAALFYLSLDGREGGRWDARSASWQPLADHARRGVARGLRVARREAPPGLLDLPMPAPRPAP